MEEEARLRKMADAARVLLECMGEDPTRPGLVDTPMRMAKAMSFFTQVRPRITVPTKLTVTLGRGIGRRWKRWWGEECSKSPSSATGWC